MLARRHPDRPVLALWREQPASPAEVLARYEAVAALFAGLPAARALTDFQADAGRLVRHMLDEGPSAAAAFWPALDVLVHELALAAPTGAPPAPTEAEALLAALRRKVALVWLPVLPRERFQARLDAPDLLSRASRLENELLAWQAPPAEGLEARLFRAIDRTLRLNPAAEDRLALAELALPLRRAWLAGRPIDQERLRRLEALLDEATPRTLAYRGLARELQALTGRWMVTPGATDAWPVFERLQGVLDGLADRTIAPHAARATFSLLAEEAERTLDAAPPEVAMPARAIAAIAAASAHWPLDELPRFMATGVADALGDLAAAARAASDPADLPDFQATLGRWSALVAGLAAAVAPADRARHHLAALRTAHGPERQAPPLAGPASDLLERLEAASLAMADPATGLDAFRLACAAATLRLEAYSAWSLELREPLTP